MAGCECILRSIMNSRARTRFWTVLLLVLLAFPVRMAFMFSTPQEPKPQDPIQKDQRGLGVRPDKPDASEAGREQTKVGAARPEIVLQAGISSPQTQISFSPDGRLLASMGMFGNAIKLWDVATGRLLRQLESSIPSMGASSMSRPFKFSADGRTLIAVADDRVRRWEVDTGRELNNTLLPTARTFFSALLSENGQTLAALNMTSSAVKVWDTTTGRELRSIAFEEDENIAAQGAIALSPDGKLLAALTESQEASRKGVETKLQLTLWEVTSGRKTQTLKVQTRSVGFGLSTQQVASLAFSYDGGLLAVRDESLMKIWDVVTGRELKSFESPGIVTSTSDPFVTFASKFSFSPDGRLLALVKEGSKIDIVDASSGATLRTLADSDAKVVGLSITADGKLLASSGTDNQITLWDVATGRQVSKLSGAAMSISDIAFSTNGRSLAVAGPQAVTLWELTTGGVRRALTLPDDYAGGRQDGMFERSSTLSNDGRLVIAGSNREPAVKIWDVTTGRELSGVSLTAGKELANAVFSDDGRVLAVTERARKKDASTVARATQSTAQVPSMLPDGVAMPDMSRMMEMAKKDPKKMQEQMKKVQDAMAKDDLSAGMDMMASIGMMPASNKASKDANNLRLLEASSGKQLQAIALPGGFLNDMMGNSPMSSSALSFSSDGRVLASATGFNGPIVLRDATTGQELRTLKTAFSLSVNNVAWSPDSKRLASAHWGINKNLSDPKTAEDFSFEDMKFSIRVWDAQTGTELRSLAGHNNFVNTLAFSGDGKLLASGSHDSTIKLWDVATGSELRTLKGHSGSITAINFTPDGQFLVSGSDDGSARLWKTQTGELLATMVSLNKGDDWLVVTPDGLFDGSPGGWNQILWRFTPGIFDVSPVEIFFNEYFHPGLLPDILAGRKLSAAVDISQKDRRQPKLTLALADGQSAGPDISTRTLKVRINVTDAPAGAGDVRLFRNGSLVKAWRGDVLQGQSSATLDTTVSILAGKNQFTAYAFNRDNVKSTDATLSLNGAGSLKRPATLHLLVMGVDQYANSEYNLKYAAADARAFGSGVEREQRKLGRFEHIEVTSLLDQNVTKGNVLYALQRLAGTPNAKAPAGSPAELEGIKPAEPEDAVIVYYAGHGTAQQQRFYLITHDLGYEGKRNELDEAGLRAILAHSISDLELEQTFEGIDAGMMLMVIDACNSGQALETEEKRRGPMNSKGLAQLAYEKGMYILTAAQSYQAALEAEQLGHGYLTFALVEEGLKSAAADDQPKDGQVVLREWLDYATERVPRMQEAKMHETRGVGLSIAFVEGQEKVADVDKRSLQRPRVFYRRELEAQPLVVAKP
jgi:WD40 repeat protein